MINRCRGWGGAPRTPSPPSSLPGRLSRRCDSRSAAHAALGICQSSSALPQPPSSPPPLPPASAIGRQPALAARQSRCWGLSLGKPQLRGDGAVRDGSGGAFLPSIPLTLPWCSRPSPLLSVRLIHGGCLPGQGRIRDTSVSHSPRFLAEFTCSPCLRLGNAPCPQPGLKSPFGASA